MITQKYFVYYPKPRGDNRPIIPPLWRGGIYPPYPPMFGAPGHNYLNNTLKYINSDNIIQSNPYFILIIIGRPNVLFDQKSSLYIYLFPLSLSHAFYMYCIAYLSEYFSIQTQLIKCIQIKCITYTKQNGNNKILSYSLELHYMFKNMSTLNWT